MTPSVRIGAVHRLAIAVRVQQEGVVVRRTAAGAQAPSLRTRPQPGAPEHDGSLSADCSPRVACDGGRDGEVLPHQVEASSAAAHAGVVSTRV
jgi:hypothetical protein